MVKSTFKKLLLQTALTTSVLATSESALAIISCNGVDVSPSQNIICNNVLSIQENLNTIFTGSISGKVALSTNKVITFEGSITANQNTYGLRLNSDSDITFNNIITTNQNTSIGFQINDAQGIITNNIINANSNGDKGISIEKSQNVTLNSTITANNNPIGINIENSNNITLNGEINLHDNSASGINIENSNNITFNAKIFANNSRIVVHSQNITFEKDIDTMKSIYVSSNGSAIFNGNIFIDNPSNDGGFIGIVLNYGTADFNNHSILSERENNPILMAFGTANFNNSVIDIHIQVGKGDNFINTYIWF